MTGPARMRRTIAATMIAVFIGAFGFAAWWINGKLLPRPRGEWSTQHLADPVELIAGESTIRVSRFVLNFERESLTLERDELSFNDYGDATRTGGEEPLRFHVRFDREDTNRFEIVLKNGFRQRFRLVVSPPPANTHRLIVLGEPRRSDRQPVRMFELRGTEIVPDELGNRPQPEEFGFDVLAIRNYPESARGGLGMVHLSGSLKKSGYLELDPNYYGFSSDGSIGSKTMMAGPLFAVVFKYLGQDPSDRGRRAYELHADGSHPGPWTERTNLARLNAGRFVLVLGPNELSEHRLLIKSEGKAEQVLRLRDRNRDNHRFMLKSLSGAPEDEREAFKELGRLGNYDARAFTGDGHVRSLHLLTGDLTTIDPILRRFPRLTTLAFTNTEIPPMGLTSLEGMKELSMLYFWSCEFTDPGLASVGRATSLRHLCFYGCNGPTSEGIAHLSGLAKIEHLEIRRDDMPAKGPILDGGLKCLDGMKSLKHLNLTGQQITDDGLVHVGRLRHLRKLWISGHRLTEKGLRELEELTELEELSIYPFRGSPAAIKALREKLPNLR